MMKQITYSALFGIFLLSSLAFAGGGGSGCNGGCNGGGGEGQIRLNITDGYYDLSGIWDNETTIYNGTDFQLNITNKGSKISRNTTLIISLHPLDYPSVLSVSVNGHVIPQSEFGYGTPGWIDCNNKNYQEFPPHGIFPANYSLYDVGNIPAGSSLLVTINISSSIGFPKTHYDAAGFSLASDYSTQQHPFSTPDGLCQDFKTPNSHDAGTNGGNVPSFPSAAVPITIALIAPIAAYKFSK